MKAKETAAERLLNSLHQPNQEHRPIPFWSWNDKLDAEELRRQIRLMKGSGVGGYFMHARSGLQTEYLEEPWFESVAAGVEEGQKTGLNAWIYDEEGWPSGFGGGKVTAKGEWLYARGLRLRRLQVPEQAVQSDDLLGIYACTANDEQCRPIRSCQSDEQYTSYIEMTQSASPFYIDVLNQAAVAQFIQVTHEQYAKRFPLGEGGLKGFFTDEPRLSEGPIPWSNLLPDAFRERFGYDLMDYLPALYLPCAGYRKVRHNFWALVNELFVTAYMKQLGDWCEAHKCKLTGHMMMEESLYSQMTGTGGVMPFYEYMQQPGVDSLRRNVGDPRIPKQVGSVAEQLGKKTVLSESFAMSGWDLNFAEMRWIAGWQFVNGVNLICQHLQAYSLKGARKRDYPPSLFYQQTWYGEYHRFNDYLARLGQLLGDNHKFINVLMLHPMHSGWVSYDGVNNPEIQALDAEFVRATELLSGAHIDYHLGDEEILHRHGRILTDGRLQVGQYVYSAVVVPSCLTIDRTTLNFLQQMAEHGLPLIRLGQWPKMCEGVEDKAVCVLEKQSVLVNTVQELHDILDPYLERPLRIREQGKECQSVHACQVQVPGGTALYLVNMDRTVSHSVEIVLPGSMKVCQLELDTMEQHCLIGYQDGDSTVVSLPLRAMETAVLVYEPGELLSKELAPATICKPVRTNWNIVEMEQNTLTLDACTYSINNGPWQPEKAVIHLMQELLDLRKPCNIQQRFSFTLRCSPEQIGRLALVMEQPHQFTVTVNGHSVEFPAEASVFDGEKNYKDLSFYIANIKPFVQQGVNTVECSTRFYQTQHVYDVLYGENVYETELNKLTYDMELESLYLRGDFGVYSLTDYTSGQNNSVTTLGPFVLDRPPQQLQRGNFTVQGLTFFAEHIRLENVIVCPKGAQRVTLDLGKIRAPLVQVKVNAQQVKTFLWGPYECDVTEWVHPGENVIEVTLYASNRNLLGPHHHTKREPYSVGPISFTGKFSWAERDSEAVVITPEMRLQNFWTDDWSFVTFGC